METRETYGRLKYNTEQDRYGVIVDGEWWIEGLHCGMCFDALIGSTWTPTRIEYAADWYLVEVGISGDDLQGLAVRFKD